MVSLHWFKQEHELLSSPFALLCMSSNGLRNQNRSGNPETLDASEHVLCCTDAETQSMFPAMHSGELGGANNPKADYDQ